MLEGKQAECGKGKNWDEAFHLYADVNSWESDESKVRGTIKLAKMSRYAPENVLELTVPILLELLPSPPNKSSASVQEASAYCLKCIASRGEGRLAELIGQLGAIPVILELLPSSGQALQINLLKCLLNVITFWAPNRIIVASNGGLEIILDLMNTCSNNSKLILLEILSALALIREVRKSLWNLRRVHLLVEAASCGSLVSRTRAAQAIGLLGLIKRARRMLVNAGSVPALIDLLKVGDPDMKLVAGNALGVLSSHVDHIRPIAQAGAIPLFAELLKATDPIGKEIAEDVFSVLAVFEENATTIIELLVGILRGDDAGAKAAAADVIWDLSNYESAVYALQNSGAIAILVELLKDEDINVKEKVAGAVAQLTTNDDIRGILANFGAIPLLISLFDDESDELSDNAAEALVNFCLDPLLADHTSYLSGNPLFEGMHGRVMQMRTRLMQMESSMEHLDASLRQVNAAQLSWHPGLI